MSPFSERSKKILLAIVQDYIRTAEPVSSKAIAMKYAFGLSPATIRNIMAELENEGYLLQPHTSAGRVPTDKSFRLYIDSLPAFDDPPQAEKEIIRKSCEQPLAIEHILTEAARALSLITNCAGLMFAPKRDSFVIKHINLVPMDRTGIMVVIVSSLGMVETKLVRMPSETGRENLEKITNYLNSIAEGLTIKDLRARIIEEMRKEKNLYDELMARTLSLGALAFGDSDEADNTGLHVEGKVNILDHPEFRDDFERMKKLFAAFEEKSLLLRLLDRSLDEDGIHIYLGSESLVKEFDGLSFVTAPYGNGGGILGTIGVAGPVRMNYSKIIPLVEYTSGLLSKALAQS